MSVWIPVSVLRVPARWQRRPVARHPVAVSVPLAPARLRTCLSARRPSLESKPTQPYVSSVSLKPE